MIFNCPQILNRLKKKANLDFIAPGCYPIQIFSALISSVLKFDRCDWLIQVKWPFQTNGNAKNSPENWLRQKIFFMGPGLFFDKMPKNILPMKVKLKLPYYEIFLTHKVMDRNVHLARLFLLQLQLTWDKILTRRSQDTVSSRKITLLLLVTEKGIPGSRKIILLLLVTEKRDHRLPENL